jgi:hypothetical protein
MEIEHKIIKAWEYRGRKCIVLWVSSHFCGYAETKFRINYNYEQESPESKINIHGGVTFSGTHEHLEGNPFDKDIWYFGFDCAHYDDYVDFKIPNYTRLHSEDEHKWTEEEVIQETEKLVDEILDYEYSVKSPIFNFFKNLFRRKK